jgi:hypothetical protein
MNFKGCYRHTMNRVALGFFIAALVCFGVFHFVPMWERGRGWIIWSDVFEFFKRLRLLRVYPQDLRIGLILGWSLQFLTGPILTRFICRAKLACRMMVFISFAALIGFGWLLREAQSGNPYLWILASQALHLLGCLCIRRPKPEEFVPAHHPDA